MTKKPRDEDQLPRLEMSPSVRTKKGAITKKKVKEAAVAMGATPKMTYADRQRMSQRVFKACGGTKIQRQAADAFRKRYTYYMNPGPRVLTKFLKKHGCSNLRDFFSKVARGEAKLP